MADQLIGGVSFLSIFTFLGFRCLSWVLLLSINPAQETNV